MLVPEAARLRNLTNTGCRRFPTCLVQKAGDVCRKIRPGVPTRFVACPAHPRDRVILLSPFQLAGDIRCCLACACLPRAFSSVDPSNLPVKTSQHWEVIPPWESSGRRNTNNFLREMLVVRQHVIDVSATFRSCNEFAGACVAKNESLNQVLRLSQSLVESPEDDSAFLQALFSFPSVHAVAHLEAVCNRRGGGSLRHRWLMHRGNGFKPERAIRTVGDVEFRGILLDGWNPVASGAACDADRVESLIASNDPLGKYFKMFRSEIEGCSFVIIGRLTRDVTQDCCYARPDCTWFKGCSLHHDPTLPRDSKLYPWRKRIMAVDLLFAREPSITDKARMMLIQTVSLLRTQRLEREALEGDIVRGLPRLSREEQALHLRRLFYRYRAVRDAQQKGALFEQLTRGLLSLVPGWIDAGMRLDTPTNEFDLIFRVESQVSGAQYWRDAAITRIIIECKNYPQGLPAGNYVQKLRANLARSGAQLGLLLNTGDIDRSLRVGASKCPRCGRWVVLLDGDDVERMAMNPGDIENFIKDRVQRAQMGVVQLSAGQRPTRARRN